MGAEIDGQATGPLLNSVGLNTSEWLFVVCDPEDAAYLGSCEMHSLDRAWLDVEPFSKKQAFAGAIKGRKVIVVVPAEGAAREHAMSVAALCRKRAAVVIPWEVDGLGSHATPNLAIFHEKCDIEKTLCFDRPWEAAGTILSVPKPSANGNGKAGELVDYTALSDEELGLVRARDVKIEPIEWLWNYRLAQGEMALIAGEGGLGKSLLLAAIASIVSCGEQWPDRSGDAPLGNVLILSAEDSPSKTIVPRLLGLGADLDRIIIQRAQVIIKREGKEPMIHPVVFRNLGYWRAAVERHKPLLLIVDPVTSYLGRGINDSKNNEIRDILEPFIEQIVRPYNLCLLANTHLSKSVDSKNPMHRISGSIAYVNIPRNVHIVVRDPDNKERRIFAQAKCNNAPDTLPGIAYTVEARYVQTGDSKIETSMLVFSSELIGDIDLRNIMAADAGKRGPDPIRSDEFADWLKDQLEGQEWVLVAELVNRAREAELLLSPTDDDRDPSVSPLYNAKERISEKYRGFTVDARKSRRGEFPGNKDRALWRLVRIEVGQ